MGTKLLQATLVDVLDSLATSASLSPRIKFHRAVHACCASGNLAAFLHALELPPAVRLGFAHHVVVIVGFASCSDEEGSTKEGRRTGSKFFDLGYIIGERGRVDKGLLVESAHN